MLRAALALVLVVLLAPALATPARADVAERAERRAVTYSVITRGKVTASMEVFRRQAQETYDDPRGWRAGGMVFRRVRRGGDFTLVLASAGAVPSFSPSCSASWSCRVGRYVIINQYRWRNASAAWNRSRRTTRDYRHLVVNHETGHCSVSGTRPARGAGARRR